MLLVDVGSSAVKKHEFQSGLCGSSTNCRLVSAPAGDLEQWLILG